MMIYPTIELLDGRCVSLYHGRLDAPTIWHVDPIETARGFAAAGASWMHLTDFDAMQGDARNHDLVVEIVRQAGIPVQYGGGVRTLDGVQAWLDVGMGRVVIGAVALADPDLVKEAAKYHPDQIVLAMDVSHDRVMTESWESPSAFTPEGFLALFEHDPLAAILVTDIDAHREDAEDALALVTRLAGVSRTPVIARGIARSMDDLARLKYVPHISGAILGRALFDRSVDLAEALELARPQREPRAEFL